MSLLLDDEEVLAAQLLIDAHLAELAQRPDPLTRLLDPAWKETVWEYEHSKIGNEIPGSLHAKQMEMLQAQARTRWLFWGNQVGKTSFGAVDTVLLALGRHPFRQFWKPPIHAWASALTWELWENILLPELLTWIPPDRLVDAPQPKQASTKRDIVIRADNGQLSRITGKAAKQGAGLYQSARIHRIWCDEEHPESIYDEIQPRLLRFGGDSLYTMTPLKGLTWIAHRIYDPYKAGKLDPKKHFVSHAGLHDNPSIRAEEVEDLKRELQHNPSQLAARLYGHIIRPAGAVLPWDPNKHCETIDEPSLTVLLARSRLYAGIDFGAWRFAFVLSAVDRAGRMHIIDEMFSQRESLDDRAQKIHDKLTRAAAPKNIQIWGDCANPTDILELNLALMRIQSPYRVVAVDSENKIRKVGVSRMENLLNRGALLVRRSMGEDQVWMLGQNANRPGKPAMGSRWMWEAANWLYPKTEDDKTQKDDPDDASADGADMMAATRYMVMSWWKGQDFEVPTPTSAFDPKVLQREYEESRKVSASEPATSRRGSLLTDDALY